MKPRTPSVKDPQSHLFEPELVDIIDLNHPLAKLAKQIPWDHLEEKFGEFYVERTGSTGKPTRLMAGLQYLKYTYNLSDEDLVWRWLENPYWQYFCGEKYFQRQFPIHPTSMTKWRQRVGEEGVESLLSATTETGFNCKVIKQSSLDKLNVDTTVQEKNITYPTDAKLYEQMRKRLVNQCDYNSVILRQYYPRVFKTLLRKTGKYYHARQPKRAQKQIRKMHTRLGRIVRDIERKIAGNADLEAAFAEDLALAKRLLEQKRTDSNKVYSVHALEVECISKGKAHKTYEFGNKVGVVTTSKEGFIVGTKSFHGNPYDGHTLKPSLAQVKKILKKEPNGAVFVDKGYRGHDYKGEATVYLSGQKRMKESLKKWLKRRSAIEATIGHMKQGCRLGRNYLKGKVGDQMNAILSACGWNLHLILNALAKGYHPSRSFLRFIISRLFGWGNFHHCSEHKTGIPFSFALISF